MDDLRVKTPAAPPEMRFDPEERRSLRSARRAFEAWYVRRVLDTCGGNRQEATEWLDISLSSLKDKLREGEDYDDEE